MIRINDNGTTHIKCLLNPLKKEASQLKATDRGVNWEREIASLTNLFTQIGDPDATKGIDAEKTAPPILHTAAIGACAKRAGRRRDRGGSELVDAVI